MIWPRPRFFGHVLVLLQDGRIVQRGSLDDLRRRARPIRS